MSRPFPLAPNILIQGLWLHMSRERFRCEIEHCAAESLKERLIVGDELCEAEIRNLDSNRLRGRDKDVFGLEIAMRDTLLVQILYSFQHLLADFLHLALAQLATLVEEIPEVAILDEFEADVHVHFVLVVTVIFDDIWLWKGLVSWLRFELEMTYMIDALHDGHLLLDGFPVD